ncbi:MAG TPA: cupredoxin family copper-binding protein [Ilumatobacteraceae bacterium]|nr:cupredoxin family copper-binding protein [Ilumatobacteraceae bacterium]
MRYRWMFLAAFLLPAMASCSTDSSASSATSAGSQASSATPVGSQASGGSDVSVGIAGFKFGPPQVKVPVGGSVVWKNDDSQAHTATAAGTFDAGAIDPGKTATVVFKTAGTFTYMCSFHPFMTGTVTVG